MSAVRSPTAPAVPLVDGDRLTRNEFHRRYEAMPHVNGAELIEGVVHMPSPVRWNHHTRPTNVLDRYFLGVYEDATPGTAAGGGASLLLDEANEFQPDGLLMILPEWGGRASITAEDYLEGAPELVAEVSASTVAKDLGDKRTAYRRAGVREYIVVRPGRSVEWFALRGDRYEALPADADGVVRSEVFPGLWLDTAELLRLNGPAVRATVERGLATPEHAAFVAQLAARRARHLLDRPGVLAMPAVMSPTVVPPLIDGDRLTRDEFHRRYEAMPHVSGAELIEGVVHMPSPVRADQHGRPHQRIQTWLGTYEDATPGVIAAVGTTVFLDDANEFQPDGLLLIAPQRGGRTAMTAEDSIEGPPELVVEISASTAAADRGDKRTAYRRAGVRECLVVRPGRSVEWFALRGDRDESLAADADGVVRCEVFPDLWLDTTALLRLDGTAVRATLQRRPRHTRTRRLRRDPRANDVVATVGKRS